MMSGLYFFKSLNFNPMIVPDIEIKPTIEGFRNGEDELLNKSIDILEDSKKL